MDRHVLEELFLLVFQSAKPQVASAIGTVVASVWLAHSAGRTSFLAWGFCGFLIVAARAALVCFHRRIMPAASHRRLLSAYTLLTLVYGAFWGVGYGLIPSANSSLHQDFLLMYIIAHTGMLGGSALLHASWRPAIAAFIWPSPAGRAILDFSRFPIPSLLAAT